ncbi:MAG TPA: hypothetical protein VM221_02850 [Armatimonadota bacterium]|nr:hypothetical protein [Armatimonadota bacterium]
MARKAVLALAAALVVLTAAPSSPLILGRITRSRSSPPRTTNHLVINVARPRVSPRDRLLGSAIRRACGSTWSRVPAYAAYLQRRGRLDSAWRPRWDRTVVLTVRGRAYRPRATGRAGRQFGGGSITFTYSGWTSADRQRLSAYVNSVYPMIRSIYGDPASTITVTIVSDPALQDILGGVYLPAVNEIRLPPIQDFSRDTFVLASLIVRAFHDDLFLAPEAWETGFARAVALVAHLQVDATFDLAGEPYYLLPFYDLLNQRPLAGATLFPASGYSGMTPWRIGMAQAAWLKVYAENRGFFRDFNTAYYAEYDPAVAPPLSDNVARLRELAAAAAPEVEGALFASWFARQFVLDSDGGPGEKLYLVALPQTDNVTVYLEADCYRTTTTDDEQPLNGTGQFHFMGWDGDLYLPEAGDLVTIQSGQGFLAPSFFNIGGAQRITVELAAGNQVAQSWFPYGVAGSGAYNEYFGVVVDGDAGSVSVSPGGAPPAAASVIRGVFAVDEPAPLDFLAQTAIELQPTAGVANLRQVNTGFLFHVFALRAYPLQAGTAQHTFGAGMAMVSLPVSPDQSDAADLLGLAPGATLLARWTPTLPGAYAFYPNTPPIEPGLGYWLKLSVPITVSAHGLLPSGQYRLHLRRGWQQIANPFTQTVAASAVQVKVADGAAMTMPQARAAGLAGSLFRYNGAYVVAQDLRPYEGLWLYVYAAEGCWLTINEP